MKEKRLTKNLRHQELVKRLDDNPLLNDEELAKGLGVSIQTIRLDRLTLGLPELKERTKSLAARVLSADSYPASLEVVGELLLCEPGVGGLSRLVAEEGMRLARYNVIRGHFLFAQANSLAVAVADAPHALTVSAQVDFINPVKLGQVLLARARVIEIERRKSVVEVVTKVEEKEVFHGRFLVITLEENHLMVEE